MDEKYKSLKSKHELLKEGFKKLYSDYETVKNDLSAKLEEFSKLHEENSQLKHNYDLLLNEINQPTRLKGVQSWTNALTLIKGGTDTDTQKYIDEINTLKAKLESTLKLTEAMDLEKRELERDMEDMKAKHGVVVSELKDRLLGLESILKDLQEQLNKNELKLTQYTSDIKSLNTELQHKNHQIFQLQLLMENSRTAYESEKLQWDRKLNEKFKFDLRRNPHINLNNSYQNTTSHEMCVDGMSCGELSGRIIASLSEVFKSWSNCLRFIPSGVSSDAFSTESDCTFVTLFTQDLHLLRNLDSTTREIEGIIVKICHGLEFVQATGYFKLFLQLMKQLIKHQRIYFCLENFLTHFNPQDGGNSGTIGNSCTSVTSGEVNLIRVFGSFDKVLTKLYQRFNSIIYMTELQSVNYSTLLINELINQFSSSNTTHTPDTNTIESNPTDGNPTDGNTIELLLGKCYGVVYNLIREMCVLLMELREILSHRICYPKIVKGMFLPFTGGTKQMVQLSSSITHLHSQLSSITKSRLKTLFNKIFNRNTRCNNNNNNNNNNSISSNSNNGNVVSYVVRCNEKLLSSGLRIDLKSLESELAKLKRSEVELSELRLKYATAQEELSIVRLNSENYLKELESLKQTNHIQHICTKLFQQTFNKYSTNFCNKEPFANSVEASVTSVDACVPSVDACVPSVDACVPSEDPVSTHLYMCKLMNNVRYLMKMVSNLEDVNGQLRLALQVNRDQYRLAKENEDAIHRNYNDQLVLMSEHITELNNTILNSEYKIAELTQTKVSCPSCGFNNTLGSMMGVDDKGRCSSCRCIIIFSSN